jgi:hypothetical protein
MKTRATREVLAQARVTSPEGAMLVEQLVATAVVVLVGGAVIGIVLKTFLGGTSEDKKLAKISEKYRVTPDAKATDKASKKPTK